MVKWYNNSTYLVRVVEGIKSNNTSKAVSLGAGTEYTFKECYQSSKIPYCGEAVENSDEKGKHNVPLETLILTDMEFLEFPMWIILKHNSWVIIHIK